MGPWSGVAIVTALGLAVMTRTAAADSMGCKGGLIVTGASMALVQTRCGAPTASSRSETVRVRHGLAFRTVIDVWTYDTGGATSFAS
jgi:Protein of unknown function (DUF2845)